jgi:ribosomal protein L17
MICIGFYCGIEPSNNTVIPWLVRTNLSTVLYKSDVCMKLFNMVSPKFGERGGSNRVAHLPFT